MDRIRNEYIRGSLKVASVTEKIRSKRLAWYGQLCGGMKVTLRKE
jgi:hypothetical protein